MDAALKDMVDRFDELSEQWQQMENHQMAQWERFKKLLVKQQLAGVMDQMKNGNGVKDILVGNQTAQGDQDADNVKVKFNLGSGLVSVRSNEVDDKGQPLFEWIMDP